MKEVILIIDDDPHVLHFLREHLSLHDFSPKICKSANEGLEFLKNNHTDLVLTDVHLDDMSGDEILEYVKREYPDTGVMLMSGYGSISNSVNAIRNGADDYIAKPFSGDEILTHICEFFKNHIQRPYDLHQVAAESRKKPVSAQKSNGINKMDGNNLFVGESPQITKLVNILPQIAKNMAPVMIQGESGCGKEVYARLIQQNSNRASGPYITINCANLPSELVESTLFGHVKGAFTGALTDKKGAFEEADGGTLLLDEVTETNIQIQAKLLRVLQEKEIQPVGSTKVKKVNVRIISTTNRDITKAINEGKFRKDLYFRLNVFPIHIPPLRKRLEDIPALAGYFCNKYSGIYNTNTKTISAELLKYLKSQSWSGNVRELENTIQRGVLMSGTDKEITVNHILNNLFDNSNQGIREESYDDLPLVPIHVMEKQLIQKALEKTHGNQKEAARILQISDRTIRNKLRSYMAT